MTTAAVGQPVMYWQGALSRKTEEVGSDEDDGCSEVFLKRSH